MKLQFNVDFFHSCNLYSCIYQTYYKAHIILSYLNHDKTVTHKEKMMKIGLKLKASIIQSKKYFFKLASS